jgi:hypothetical protein
MSLSSVKTVGETAIFVSIKKIKKSLKIVLTNRK